MGRTGLHEAAASSGLVSETPEGVERGDEPTGPRLLQAASRVEGGEIGDISYDTISVTVQTEAPAQVTCTTFAKAGVPDQKFVFTGGNHASHQASAFCKKQCRLTFDQLRKKTRFSNFWVLFSYVLGFIWVSMFFCLD